MECMTALRSLYQTYEESWASQDWDAWMATLSPDYQFRIGDQVIGGREETLAWSEALFATFPDYTQEIVSTHVDEGSGTVITEAVGHGTASGDVPLMPGGPVPEAGSSFDLPYVKILIFNDGLLRHDRQYHDRTAMLAQLGLLSSSTSESTPW